MSGTNVTLRPRPIFSNCGDGTSQTTIADQEKVRVRIFPDKFLSDFYEEFVVLWLDENDPRARLQRRLQGYICSFAEAVLRRLGKGFEIHTVVQYRPALVILPWSTGASTLLPGHWPLAKPLSAKRRETIAA